MPADLNRILIVEDDAGLADLLSDGLRKHGFHVAVVGTGSACLAWLAGNGVDLLLIDYSLPDMTGTTLIEEMRRTGTPHPFIVTTGHGDENVAVGLMKLGALDYLMKDARLFERLPGVVMRTLQEVATRRQLEASERALRESEERFRHVSMVSSDLVYSCTRDEAGTFTIDWLAGAVERIAQCSAEELKARRCWRFLVVEEDRSLFDTHVAGLRPGESGTCELRLQHPGGTLLWVVSDARCVAVPGQPGRHRLHGALTDISARKRAEIALEKRLVALTRPLDATDRLAFDEVFNVGEVQTLQDHFARATGVASIITQPDGTPITQPSNFRRLCAEIIRSTPDGLRNCFHSDAVIGRQHAGGPIVQPCLSGGLWDAGASIVVGGQHIANWLVGQVRNEVQDEAKMRVYARQIGADEGDFIQAFQEVPAMSRQRFEEVARALYTMAQQLSSVAYQNIQQARFIAERKRAEEALRESEKRYRQLVDNSPMPIVVHQDGRFVFVNDAALAMVSARSRDMLLGTPVLDRVHPADHELANRGTRLVMETGAATPLIEIRLRRFDGSVANAEIVATSYVHEGRPAVQVVVHDITERKRAQADFKMLFDTMLDGFALHEIICDAGGRPVDYRFKAVNPAFTRLTGLTAEAAVGRTVMELMPETEPFWIETYGRVALTGEPVQFEHYSVAIGKYFEVAAFRTAPGQFAVVFVDETKRTLAQAALARDEAELAAIYDHAPVMMLLVDSERKVRRLNRAALEFAGRTTSDSVGLRAGELLGCLHALDDPRGCGYGPDCGECPLRLVVVAALVNGTTSQRVETHPRMVRGREVIDVTLLASAAPLTVANDRMVLLCLEDISLQKIAEQRGREQAALLDVTRDAILVIDLDGLVSYWNRGAELLYGWPAAEVGGRPLRELIFDQPIPAEAEAAFHAIRHQKEWSGELGQRTRDGAAVVALCRGVLMHDAAGEARSMLITASDITAAKHIERQFLRAQRLETLGSLAGGVAHDLNNVFTPILMSVEMLRPLACEPHDREMIQLLGDSIRRGTDIVRQLLVFGRGSDSPRGKVSVAQAILELRRMMQETFPKNIAISTSTPADLWAVHGDQTQLHQVLLNLCVNARDAMPQGGRLTLVAENLHVEAALANRHFKARPGPHVFFRVTDTGTGIPPEVIEKIFDPFFTTKPEGQGTGLGLATVLSLVRGHGGFVSVRSQPGAGSEFGVYLPAMASEGGTPASADSRDTQRGQGELILLVDDEASIRILLERALKLHGYAVIGASNGAAAVDLVRTRGGEIRLVVTDMMMPQMDGIALARAVRQLHPQLPIVAISGIPGHRAELDRLPPPTIPIVAKPFTIVALLATLREALDNPATP